MPITTNKTIAQTLFSLMNHEPAPYLQEILASPELIPFLDINGVAGVLFYYLRQDHLKHAAPADVYEVLQNRFRFQIGRNMACAAAARIVFRLLLQAGIPFLVLKGLALAENIYPHFAMRTTSDLDILISKDDLLRADLALSKAGYHAQDSTPGQAILNPPGYLASLEYHKPGNAFAYVHLHWHLVNSSTPAITFIKNINMEEIWKKSIVGKVAAMEVRLLCPEHLIIYLCEHALRVGHSFDRLNLVCDIFYAVKSCEAHLDWDIVSLEARAMGLLKFVYHGLQVVQSYSGKNFLSKDILNKFASPSLSWFERLFAYLHKRHYRLRGSSYLVYLALSKGIFNKGRLILRTLFPPRPVLAQRMRCDTKVHAQTLYCRRMGEIMLHLNKMFKLLYRTI